MSIYQVQYKKDSHTYVSDIEADSKDDVLVLFNDLVVAEVLEIRKYVYKNIKYPLDDGDYQKGVSFTLINDKLQFHKISLKKIKKNLSITDISSYIKTFIKHNESSKYQISSIKSS